MKRAHINGIQIAYELRGGGTPIVMIHGAQGDQTMFSGMAAAFANRFQVLTFDQRGSGLSEKPEMDYSIAMLADDTAALMDHVGFAAAHVIGVSMGGTVAQELAIRHPRKVLSVVLGCTTAGGPNAVRLSDSGLASAYSTRPMSAEERGRALAEAAFTRGYLDKHPEVVAGMIEARRNRPLDPAALGRRMNAIRDFDAYDRLAQIKSPTLVITGKDDALVPWENSRILADRIAGAQLVILQPAGHCFWLEQPEQSAEAIQNFIDAHSAAAH